MKNLRGFEEVIKNNKSKNQNKKPKYAMRKLTVGLVSCMMGYLIAFTPSVSNAAEVGTENVAPKEAAPEETNAGVEGDQTPKEAISPAGETSEATSANPTTEKAVAPNKDSQPAGELNTSKENAPQAETASGEVVKKQADSFNASIKDITVKENQEINYKDAVENLPQDAKLEVLTPAKTDNIGESIAKAKIVFSDGSEKEIKIKVTVEANDELSANSQATEATTESAGSNVAKRRVPRAASMIANNTDGIATREAAAPEDTTTDKNAKNAVHGYVGVQSSGDINLNLGSATGGAFTPVEGVRVYFQWFENGGYVSPTYTTVSGPDGRIHLAIKPFLAADGKIIKFDADPTVSGGNERYKFWVDEKTIPEKYQLQYIIGENVVIPDAGLPITQGGASSDTVSNTHNNWKVLLMEKPKEDMHKEATPTEVRADGGFVEGTVSYDYNSGIGGVQWNTVADKTSPAQGVTVKASYLSDYALKQIYSEDTVARMSLRSVDDIRGSGWTKALENQLQDWIKTQIATDPDRWIAETVSAQTNAEGKYLIQFKGTWGDYKNADAGKKEYTYKVGDPSSGQIWNRWTDEQIARLGQVADSASEGGFTTSATTNQKKHVNYDWLFVSLEGADNLREMTPYNNNQYTLMHNTYGIHSGWSGVGFSTGVTNATNSSLRADFALAPAEIKFNIVNYDAGANTATPGDIAKTSTQGLPYSNTPDSFRIVWYDEKGAEVKSEDISKPNSLGALPEATLDTSGVKENKLYTAKLYRVDSRGNNAELLAVDSFAVIVDKYIGSVYDDFTHDTKGTKGATFSAQGLPNGLEIDSNTGIISGKPTEAGKFDVTVTTTVNDQSGALSANRTYSYLITDSPVPEGMVGKEYNQTVSPKAIDGYVFKNVKVELTSAIAGLTAENNTISGTPTVAVDADQEKTNVDVTYDIYKLNDNNEEVLFAEGHVDHVPLVIKQADKATSYEPHYEETQAKVGEEVTTNVPSFTDIENAPTPIPDGTKFELGDNPPANASVNPLTGAVTYTPSAGDAGKTINVPVKVIYSDDTTDTTTAKINVEKLDDIIEVTDPNQETPQGYVRVTLESGKNIASITGTQAYDVKNDGTVKYSDLINEITKDGSKTTINVDPITGRNSLEWSVDGKEVVPTDYPTTDTTLKVSAKDAYAPKGTEQTVQKGAVVDAKDSIANKDTLPEGTTYEFVDDKGDPITPDTNSIGEKDVNVKVTYPNPTENGGPTIVKTKINVIEEKTEAEKNPAVAPEKTTVENKEKLTPEEKQEVEAKVKKSNPEATKVEVKDDGSVTLTYKDNSTNTLTPEQTIVEREKTTVEGEPTEVNPTNEEQKTGLTVKNQDETTPTTVTAKDEDGTEIPVKVDPETGEIKVTPGTNVDGPITVTIQDDDFKTEDNPKGEITKEVPVT
ncbi:putative Ig domain-containing protein, partial [Anaerococcus sp. AGMB00486]